MIAITGIGAAGAGAAGETLPEAVRARILRTERITQLALAAAHEALASAGLLVTDGPVRAGCGVVLGTGFGCFLTNAAYQRRLAAGGPGSASPRLFAATVSNAAAGELGIAYRLGGPAVTLTAGAASGTIAIAHAADLLAAGRADALVAGGVDAAGTALDRLLADAAMGTRTAMVEAAALLVLEGTVTAAARHAHVYGTIVGTALGFGRDTDVGASALDAAGLGRGDVDMVLATGEDEGASAAAWGAAGPLAVRRALAALPPGGAALVRDACVSGHVGALVVRRAML